MKEILIISSVILLLLSCNKKKLYDGPNSFSENFEDISSTSELFPEDKSRWIFFQQSVPSNTINIDTLNPHSGKQCLKITAASAETSKSDIAKNNMAFWKNDIVEFSGWYYLEGTNDLDYVFLADLEENVAIGAGPGIRIAIDQDDQLIINRKFLENTINQPTGNKIKFPRNKWVEIKFEVELTQKKKGYIKLWQDGTLIIEANNIRTLPIDKLYLIQGTKGLYSSLQVGVTATTSDSEALLYIDDIQIKKIN